MTKPPRRPREIKRAADAKAASVKSPAFVRPRRRDGQGDLFAPRRGSAPLPSFVEPCLASLVEKVPAGERWLHEIKWDGYRLYYPRRRQPARAFSVLVDALRYKP
jgi:ATP-dependent DNA ligase